MRFDLLAGAAALAAVLPSSALHLSDQRLSQVYNYMATFSKYSWENGTKSQAILEWTYPDLSVFSISSSANPFPSSGSISANQIPQIVDVAATTLRNRPATNTSGIMGGSPLLEDGAAADPASLGGAVLLAGAATGNAVVNGVGYAEAARMEVMYQLYSVPRSPTGAISHRTEQSQYWSDFTFMVPPFLATYGSFTSNQTYLQIAYDQCRLYRDFLRRPMATGALWAHIQGGRGNLDPGLWATGNAWAAYGMLRVLATIRKSPYNDQMASQRGDLQSWVGEIMDACRGYVTPNGLLRNYVNDTSSFEETSASALIAATGLRLSTLGLTDTYVPLSLTLLSSASRYVSNSSTSAGVLEQVVDPLDWSKQGKESPEGQSFMVMAYAAHKDWTSQGKKGSPDGQDGLGTFTSGGQRAVGMLCLGGAVGVLAAVGGWAVLF